MWNNGRFYAIILSAGNRRGKKTRGPVSGTPSPYPAQVSVQARANTEDLHISEAIEFYVNLNILNEIERIFYII